MQFFLNEAVKMKETFTLKEPSQDYSALLHTLNDKDELVKLSIDFSRDLTEDELGRFCDFCHDLGAHVSVDLKGQGVAYNRLKDSPFFDGIKCPLYFKENKLLVISTWHPEAALAVDSLESESTLMLRSNLKNFPYEVNVLVSLLPVGCALILWEHSPVFCFEAVRFLRDGTTIDLRQMGPIQQNIIQHIIKSAPLGTTVRRQPVKNSPGLEVERPNSLSEPTLDPELATQIRTKGFLCIDKKTDFQQVFLFLREQKQQLTVKIEDWNPAAFYVVSNLPRGSFVSINPSLSHKRNEIKVLLALSKNCRFDIGQNSCYDKYWSLLSPTARLCITEKNITPKRLKEITEAVNTDKAVRIFLEPTGQFTQEQQEFLIQFMEALDVGTEVRLSEQLDIAFARQLHALSSQLRCSLAFEEKLAKTIVQTISRVTITKRAESFNTAMFVAGNMKPGSTLVIEEWSLVAACMVARLAPEIKVIIGARLLDLAEVQTLISFLPEKASLVLSNASPLCCDQAIRCLPRGVVLDLTSLTQADLQTERWMRVISAIPAGISYQTVAGLTVKDGPADASTVTAKSPSEDEKGALLERLNCFHRPKDRIDVPADCSVDELKACACLLPSKVTIVLKAGRLHSLEDWFSLLRPGVTIKLPSNIEKRRLIMLALVLPEAHIRLTGDANQISFLIGIRYFHRKSPFFRLSQIGGADASPVVASQSLPMQSGHDAYGAGNSAEPEQQPTGSITELSVGAQSTLLKDATLGLLSLFGNRSSDDNAGSSYTENRPALGRRGASSGGE